MNKGARLLVIFSLWTPIALAQSTLYLSNLSESPENAIAVGNNSWVAALFQTGDFAGGYSLDAVQLSTSASSGTPSGFAVMIYAGSRSPALSLGSLSGPEPVDGGVVTYTASGILLSPAQLYWIVVTADTSSESGSYNWNLSSTFTYSSNDDWFMPTSYWSSSTGVTWESQFHNPLQFAIGATPIPEPSSGLLLLIGGITCAMRCIRLKHLKIINLFPVFWLSVSLTAHGQGTILSNIQKPATGSFAVADDTWIAQAFLTGSNPAGYELHAIHLLLGATTGSPDGLTISLYSSSQRKPVNFLAQLSGPSNASGDVFAYTIPDYLIEPSTRYWLVATAATAATTGTFGWQHGDASGYVGMNTWFVNAAALSSNEGATWASLPDPALFAIFATPIPEPSSGLLLLIGGIAFVLRRGNWVEETAARLMRFRFSHRSGFGGKSQ